MNGRCCNYRPGFHKDLSLKFGFSTKSIKKLLFSKTSMTGACRPHLGAPRCFFCVPRVHEKHPWEPECNFACPGVGSHTGEGGVQFLTRNRLFLHLLGVFYCITCYGA